METRDHLLIILNEEALEVGQAADKALRFGLDDDYLDMSPEEAIVYEFNDLIGVIELLQENGVKLDGLYSRDQVEAKKKKVIQLLEYSKTKGRIEDDEYGKNFK